MLGEKFHFATRGGRATVADDVIVDGQIITSGNYGRKEIEDAFSATNGGAEGDVDGSDFAVWQSNFGYYDL